MAADGKGLGRRTLLRPDAARGWRMFLISGERLDARVCRNCTGGTEGRFCAVSCYNVCSIENGIKCGAYFRTQSGNKHGTMEGKNFKNCDSPADRSEVAGEPDNKRR